MAVCAIRFPEKIVVPSAARRYGSFGSLTSGSRRQLYKSRAQSFQELMLILVHEDLNGRYEGQSHEKLLSAVGENYKADVSRPR